MAGPVAGITAENMRVILSGSEGSPDISLTRAAWSFSIEKAHAFSLGPSAWGSFAAAQDDPSRECM
jgi:hypothetical protein